jgi:hypothetical protein
MSNDFLPLDNIETLPTTATPHTVANYLPIPSWSSSSSTQFSRLSGPYTQMSNANNNLANPAFFPNLAFQNPQHLPTAPQNAVHGVFTNILMSVCPC